MVGVAQSVYLQILISGVRPSLLTFNTMINMLCTKGKVKEAKLILNKIYQFDMGPDVFTYGSLILGHCRNRNLDLAFEVFDEMVKAGFDPNEFTYSTLINGLCNKGRVDQALDMLEEMIEKCIGNAKLRTLGSFFFFVFFFKQENGLFGNKDSRSSIKWNMNFMGIFWISSYQGTVTQKISNIRVSKCISHN